MTMMMFGTKLRTLALTTTNQQIVQCGRIGGRLSSSSSSSTATSAITEARRNFTHQLRQPAVFGVPLSSQSSSSSRMQQYAPQPNPTARTMTTTSQPMPSSSNISDQSRQRSAALVVHEITANLHLIAAEPRNVKHDPKTLRLHTPIERPLVIMPAWLLVKQKPLNKYAEIYVELGFDVLTIRISPWQLLWPAKGSQLVGRDVVNFLHHNAAFNPLCIHGFSVGAYVWGECLAIIERDAQRFGHIADRIVGQVWDSAADIHEIPIGVPKAVFPRNPRLNRALSNYMQYHLRTFHEVATQHYLKSSDMFHNNMVRAPALMFVSEDDPVGSVSSNGSVRRDWERLGIACEWKCWEKSEHVSHFMRHRDEYLETLYGHLERVQLLAEVPKLRAKL